MVKFLPVSWFFTYESSNAFTFDVYIFSNDKTKLMSILPYLFVAKILWCLNIYFTTSKACKKNANTDNILTLIFSLIDSYRIKMKKNDKWLIVAQMIAH
jgi:hypothetical protein